MNERLNVGGQAVIEGVMIIGPGHYSIAVRNGKKIIAKSWKLKKGNHRLLKLPFVRGFANLARMLAIGIKSLVWSAQQAGQGGADGAGKRHGDGSDDQSEQPADQSEHSTVGERRRREEQHRFHTLAEYG